MKRLILVLAAALSGCVTDGTTAMEPQDVTAAYRGAIYDFNTSNGPVRVTLRYRTFEAGGKTAMCAQTAAEATLVQNDLVTLYFKEATLLLGKDEFGKGTFIRSAPPAEAMRRPAGCARSDLAWKPAYANTPLTVRGGQVRIVN